MSGLGLSSDAQPTDNFATIPDVPIVPVSDRVSPNQISSGVSRGIQQLGSDKVYADGGHSQVIVKDTTPRVLMGNQPTFGEGFYVSRSGIDASTNTDPAQWIFNSNQNVFKIVAKNSTFSIPSFTIGSTGTNAALLTIPHGQTFTPLVDVNVSTQLISPTAGLLAVAYVPLPIFGTSGGDLGSYQFLCADNSSFPLNVTYGVNATNIFVLADYTGTAITGSKTVNAIPISYFIRQETAT